jgi:hypothetical protein
VLSICVILSRSDLPAIGALVIRSTPLLQKLEADFTRDRIARMTFQDALDVFTSLWIEARALNSAFPTDWRSDLEPDLAIARALNGLPPRT